MEYYNYMFTIFEFHGFSKTLPIILRCNHDQITCIIKESTLTFGRNCVTYRNLNAVCTKAMKNKQKKTIPIKYVTHE